MTVEDRDFRFQGPVEPGTMEREFGREQGERADAFRKYSQRRGMPLTYGTGEPGACVPAPRKKKR